MPVTTTTPAAAAAPAPTDTLMPSYFPLKLRKCADPADDFFACFEGKAMPNGDPEVARRALAQCQETLRAYKDCMQSFVGPSAPQA